MLKWSCSRRFRWNEDVDHAQSSIDSNEAIHSSKSRRVVDVRIRFDWGGIGSASGSLMRDTELQ